MQDQRNASAAGIDSTVGESSPLDRMPSSSKDKIEENFEPLNLNIQKVLSEGESQQGRSPPFIGSEFHIEDGVEAAPNVEHQFIPSFTGRSPVHNDNRQENQELKNLLALKNDSDEEMHFSLRLGEPEPKRRRQSDLSFSTEESK